MKNVRKLLISFLVIIYISFVLFIIRITTTDYLKYLLMFIVSAIIIAIYFIFIKNIKWKNEIRKEITEDNKEKIRQKMYIINQILTFCVYTFLCICFLCALSNDGEFIVKYIYPFFRKMVSDNYIFNWIIILSPLFYINAFYNLYNEIIQIITEKYDLINKKEDNEKTEEQN